MGKWARVRPEWMIDEDHVPSCIRCASDKWADGDGEKYAYGGFLLGICTYEHSFVNAPPTFEE